MLGFQLRSTLGSWEVMCLGYTLLFGSPRDTPESSSGSNKSPSRAQSLFNRFLQSKHDKDKDERVTRRPFLATECRDLNEADKWRSQILREVRERRDTQVFPHWRRHALPAGRRLHWS